MDRRKHLSLLCQKNQAEEREGEARGVQQRVYQQFRAVIRSGEWSTTVEAQEAPGPLLSSLRIGTSLGISTPRVLARVAPATLPRRRPPLA
jgi:hypothetical protein